MLKLPPFHPLPPTLTTHVQHFHIHLCPTFAEWSATDEAEYVMMLEEAAEIQEEYKQLARRRLLFWNPSKGKTVLVSCGICR